MPPGAARPGPSSELRHPTAGRGHVCAPCGTTAHCDGDNSLPLSPPCACGDRPQCRGQLGGSRQQHGEAQDRPRPATTRARSCASAGPPPSRPGAAVLHPSACSTPKLPAAVSWSPDRTPQVLQDTSGCMLAGGIGSREGVHGAPLPSPGWLRQKGRTVLPLLQPSLGQDGAPCALGCCCPSSSL